MRRGAKFVGVALSKSSVGGSEEAGNSVTPTYSPRFTFPSLCDAYFDKERVVAVIAAANNSRKMGLGSPSKMSPPIESLHRDDETRHDRNLRFRFED